MLNDLINGREKAHVLVIEDTVEIDGHDLLNCFIASLCQRVDRIHIFSFDRDPHVLTETFSAEQLSRITVHDGFHDTLGWHQSSLPTVRTDLAQYLQEHGGNHGNQRTAIVVDSLSSLLLHRPAPYTCQTLHKLGSTDRDGNCVEQLVCLVHRDLHDNHSLTLVEHMATTVLTLSPPMSATSSASCQTRHKRPSGKITRITENFSITKQFELTGVIEFRPSAAVLPSQPESQPDPTANLTFNLSLSDQEKQARSQVILPYMHQGDRQESSLSQSGGGKIFYQPDDADDFDEEDPDDDLDI